MTVGSLHDFGVHTTVEDLADLGSFFDSYSIVLPLLKHLFAMLRSVVIATSCLFLLPDNALARSWTDIVPLHGMSPLGRSVNELFVETDPLFTSVPTVSLPTAPMASPTIFEFFLPTDEPSAPAPTKNPTPRPTHGPTELPTTPPDMFLPNVIPLNPDQWYFNYDTTPGSLYGPGYVGISQVDNTYIVGYKNNAWGNVANPPDSYWSEFDDNGVGPWSGTLANRQPLRNQCGRVGMQSPIDVRDNGANCAEHHEVRSLVSRAS
jgi:hypothetical protein